MLEVLMFIFENYMDNSVSLKTDNETILVELEKVGFDRFEIDGALSWLDGLHQFQFGTEGAPILSTLSIRHYAPEECARISIECRGFLLYLEQIAILDPASREIVIDRVMALNLPEVGLGRVKWVVLMVLFSQPDKKSALSLLQDMILSDAVGVLH